ncbi:hypothetical protein CPT_Slocum_127 [Serratia phage Slocum]|nr:hypothetical protein CPT_Slocum_127 [Serratia phage Slocum]
MSRNFVAKNDFNRGGAHKSIKDYSRVSMKEILETEDVDYFDTVMELDIDEFDDLVPLKDPKEWESNNKTTYC